MYWRMLAVVLKVQQPAVMARHTDRIAAMRSIALEQVLPVN